MAKCTCRNKTPAIEVPGYIRKHKRSIFKNVAQLLMEKGVKRTSSLIAPIERLEDHAAEVFTCEFHPHGHLLMSAGMRRHIHICSVYDEGGGNMMVMKGHGGAVMEAHFSTDGTKIYSCSSDESVVEWDTFTGIKTARLLGHEHCINTVQVQKKTPHLVCSGADDGTVRVWDVRQQINALIFNNSTNVTAVCFSKGGEHIFTGSLDNNINVWDMRLHQVPIRLEGHKDVVTGVALSPCGGYLLSHSLDCTLRIWDIRTNFTGRRCIRIINSNQYFVNGNMLRCAWSPDGKRVSAGSSDDNINIWNARSGKKITELVGPENTVNDVHFHPNEPIIASASSDGYIFLHEIAK